MDAAADQNQEDPDMHVIKYYPRRQPEREAASSDSSLLFYMKKNRVSPRAQEAAERLRRRIRAAITEYITENIGGYEAVVMTTAPSSKQGGLHQFLEEFCRQSIADTGIANVRYVELLKRTKEVEERSHNQTLHSRTIAAINCGTVLPNTLILVLDDIWTTGSTMRACKAILVKATDCEVRMLAIGRTHSETRVEPGEYGDLGT